VVLPPEAVALMMQQGAVVHPVPLGAGGVMMGGPPPPRPMGGGPRDGGPDLKRSRHN
jgi:hypothetical protein